MHELSIAYSLVETASRAAQEAGIPKIETVHLQLGLLCGVVKDALLFSYEIACEGTPLAGSRLEIKELPVIVFCPTCQTNQPLPGIQLFRCPVCGTPTPDILQGREIQLTALEYPNDPPA